MNGTQIFENRRKSAWMSLATAALLLVAHGAEGSSAPQAVTAWKDECQAHVTALRKWNMHTLPSKVMEPVQPAMAFLEMHKGTVSNRVELAELSRRIIESCVRARDFTCAVPVATSLKDEAAAGNERRIIAVDYLARGIVDAKKDYAAADALYARLLEDLQCSANDRVQIAAMRAYLHTVREDRGGAIAVIEAARAGILGDEQEKRRVGRLLDAEIAKIHAQFHRDDDALKFWLSKGEKFKALSCIMSGAVDDLALGKNLACEIIPDETLPAGDRISAWAWLWSRDGAFAEKALDSLLAGDARRAGNVAEKLRVQLIQGNIHNVYGHDAPAYFMNFQQAARTWELYRELCRKAERKPDFLTVQYGMIAWAGLGDRAKAVATAEEALAAGSFKPEECYQLALAAKILTLKGTPREIAKAVKAADSELSAQCPDKERLTRYERAGAIATVTGDEALMRGVALYFAQLRPVLPKKAYAVRFSDRLIGGAGDWGNLPFRPEEQGFERQFGGPGMAFMTTDVATGDRGNAAQDGKTARKRPTTLQAVADTWGVHFLFSFYDTRARQFESGELDGGSYECYLAPGENQPYTCFLVYPKKDALAYVMNTSYDSLGHRRTDPHDPRIFRSETFFTDDTVLNYVAFSWDTFADHVPKKGGEWDFESVFWGPVPSAWNGTESIHGRSTWGRLVFELNDAARVKILRAQLFKAVNAYKAEKGASTSFGASEREGIFDHWSDESLGDPVFYETCLAPLVEKLDAVAARVKVGMSDKDVKGIAEKHLSEFRDIRFIVARKRAEYLKKSF